MNFKRQYRGQFQKLGEIDEVLNYDKFEKNDHRVK